MMSEQNIQILEDLINLSKDEQYKINLKDLSEEDSATALNCMAQLFDLDSDKFEELYEQVGISNYCDIAVFKDIRQLSRADTIDEQQQIVVKLMNYPIAGMCFKKYVYSVIIQAMLRLRLLSKYIEFVDTALQIIKDETIPDIII